MVARCAMISCPWAGSASLAVSIVTGQDGDVNDFVGGRICLDFVATVAERHHAAHEKLTAAHDLAAWCLAAGVLTEAPAVSSEQLAAAKTMREAMFTLLGAARRRDAFPGRELALLNAAAAVPPPVVSFSAKELVLVRSGPIESALSQMSRECLELLGGPEVEFLSWCADAKCTRPFLDRSHGHRRRWCGMKGCGDRAKAAAYRRRAHINR